MRQRGETMRRRCARALGPLVAVVAVVAVAPSTAEACGGCFAPPTTVQVVTDHRMVLSLSDRGTVLWDQFRYTGRPAEFSWILPIRNGPEVRVAVASNDFMAYADAATAPQVFRPQAPSGASCGLRASAGGEFGGNGGVVVHRQEVVGPYEVTTLGGSDPTAIRGWLTRNGYTVTPAVEPVIDHYTAMRMDYVALRLRPGEGIERMSPVRVSMPGLQPTLPLRMIAAGVADKVGLSLVVLAPSRIEAQNFPNGEVAASDLRYDFDSPTDPARDFLNAFDRLNRARGGRLWLTESAEGRDRDEWLAGVVAVAQADAGVPTPGAPDPQDDVRVAFAHLGSTATVTRLRADLATTALDRDLVLRSSDLADRSRTYNYGVVLNTPDPPSCGIFCAARPWTAGAPGGAALSLLALAGAGAAVRRARRRR